MLRQEATTHFQSRSRQLHVHVTLQVFDEICRWRSYSRPQDTTLSHSIHEIINKLFERIENSHGKTLVSRALGRWSF